MDVNIVMSAKAKARVPISIATAYNQNVRSMNAMIKFLPINACKIIVIIRSNHHCAEQIEKVYTRQDR